MCDQTFNDELEMHPFFWLWLLVFEKGDVGRQILTKCQGRFTSLYTLTVWLALRVSQLHAKTVLQTVLFKDLIL